jgi:folate-binding protein YgfZ
VKLPNRVVIALRGPDAIKLLHGLTTNDVRGLRPGCQDAVFTAFLNSKGRVIADAFVTTPTHTVTNLDHALEYHADDAEPVDAAEEVLIECDADLAKALKRHLTLYKLRSKVKLSTEPLAVWASIPSQCAGTTSEPVLDAARAVAHVATRNRAGASDGPASVFADPRLPELGIRALLPADIDLAGANAAVATEAAEMFSGTDKAGRTLLERAADEEGAARAAGEAGARAYDRHRMALGVSQGVEMAGAVPLEHNLHEINGVSFDKGCYLGQELTARTRFRGVLRKRVFPVSMAGGGLLAAIGAPPPQPGAEVRAGPAGARGKRVGRLIAVDEEGTSGLALVKLRHAGAEDLFVDVSAAPSAPSESSDGSGLDGGTEASGSTARVALKVLGEPAWWTDDAQRTE